MSYLKDLPIPIEYQLAYVKKVQEETRKNREILLEKRQRNTEKIDKIQSQTQYSPTMIEKKTIYDSWIIPGLLIFLLIISILVIVVLVILIYSQKNTKNNTKNK